MVLNLKLRIDFSPAAIPGQLSAVVVYTALDGSYLAESPPQIVGAGKSLALGPFATELGPEIVAGPTPPARPANPDQTGEAGGGRFHR